MATRQKVSDNPKPAAVDWGPPAPVRTLVAYIGAGAAIVGGLWGIITNSGNLSNWWIDLTTNYDMVGTWCLMNEITSADYLGQKSGFVLTVHKGAPGHYAADGQSIAFQGKRTTQSVLSKMDWAVNDNPIEFVFTQDNKHVETSGDVSWTRDGKDKFSGVIHPLYGGDTEARSTAYRTSGNCGELIAATAPAPSAPLPPPVPTT